MRKKQNVTKRILIFEGPDGAGKSYITEAIYRRWFNNYAVFHNPFIPTSVEQVHRLMDQCEDLALSEDHKHKKILADRHTTISELIYGKVIRANTLISTSYSVAYLEKIKARIFYIRPPDTVLLTRKMEMEERDREKDHKPKLHIAQVMANYQSILEEYDKLMEELMYNIPVTWVDTSRKSEFDSFIATFNPRWKIR